MANWKSMLRADPMDWLLEPDNPSVRYWTLTDILDRPAGDPCPLANLLALKALAQVPEMRDSQAAHIGAEMLLGHWERQKERKIYLFGIGTDFRKFKYPFIWYDILHVADLLSRFSFVHADLRFREMVEAITTQADENGRYTAASIYRAWKGWSFADKKNPSPWLTFLVLRVIKRMCM